MEPRLDTAPRDTAPRDTTHRETAHGKAGGIQVIARAAAILRALAQHPHGLSLAAIATEVRLPRSTVQRITSALVEEMLLEHVGPAGGVRLGPALGQLLNRAETDIITLTRPYLQQLSQEIQESVCLCSLSGDKVYVIDRLVAERELRVVFPIGVHTPAHTASAGKILLGELSEATVRELLPDPLPSFTPATLSLEELLVQLRRGREQQVMEDYDEYIEGVGSCAVALHTYLGMYSMAVVAPTARLRRHSKAIANSLLRCKREIERAAGGRLDAR